MDTGCIRDIHVRYPSGGEAVQIGCPADLSGIHAGMTDLNHCYDPNYSHGPKFPANLPARRAQALSSLAPNAPVQPPVRNEPEK
ncbi:MAG: hypothetical protein DM484_03485 [Candidatus Methylumidiphilus alinenensis]|uniref:Uncharacterized protein n=1 Tax=Candidatus Methylumidiphilus alinenensis TaxID=2202197 RepID=A0A2W4TNZ6_9GAMM|nr:MAG: hypothetical protein DM484_03485 [Candidatus Methylumidiphilus alinenensis]